MSTDRHAAHGPNGEQPSVSRREFLSRTGTGFGALALAGLLSEEADATPVLHHAPRARSVIFLFMEGGPSHIDLFDPKPELSKLAGQPLPESFGTVITPMGEYGAPLLASQRTWKQHGAGGLWISDWLPHMARSADDLTVIRSCWTNGINHSGGVCQMNTGSPIAGRPALGNWVTYGLGSENADLPGFVVLQDTNTTVINGSQNWNAGFMPATYQGTRFATGAEPIANLSPPPEFSRARQTAQLAYIDALNRRHLDAQGGDDELEARIKSYELAYRMQAAAPEAVDLARETAETQVLYGIDEEQTAPMGRVCLLARRLVERGVRFVQIYHGAGSKWDAHSKIEENHTAQCRRSDKPVAGLLADLKRRGLLDETLVLWGGEFGRTPMSEKGDGRDHNPYGFTMCMAGARLPGGRVIGATDEIGLRAIEDRLHVHDLHASILHLLGIDHRQLIYHHKGRPERIDQNEGHVLEKLVGA
mgnify:CR=1 FL=1